MTRAHAATLIAERFPGAQVQGDAPFIVTVPVMCVASMRLIAIVSPLSLPSTMTGTAVPSSGDSTTMVAAGCPPMPGMW